MAAPTITKVQEAVALGKQATIKQQSVSAATKSSIVTDYNNGVSFHTIGKTYLLCNAMTRRILIEAGVNIGISNPLR